MRDLPVGQLLELAGCCRRAPSGTERLLNTSGSFSVSGFAEHGREDRSKLGGLDPSKSHTEAGAGFDHLFSDDGLVVADRGKDQGKAVSQRLADRVVAAMTHHGVEMAQELELGDRLPDQNVGWDRWKSVRGCHHDRLHRSHRSPIAAAGPGSTLNAGPASIASSNTGPANAIAPRNAVAARRRRHGDCQPVERLEDLREESVPGAYVHRAQRHQDRRGIATKPRPWKV